MRYRRILRANSSDRDVILRFVAMQKDFVWDGV